MSIYMNQELVRVLTQERLVEAQAARLARDLEGDERIVTTEGFFGRLARLTARRPAATPTPCQQPC